VKRRAVARPSSRGTLHLWANGVLFVGEDMVNAPHRHFTASVMYSLDRPFRIRTRSDSDWRATEGVMVAPNVEQQMDGAGAHVVILQVDPETLDYGKIAHHFERNGRVNQMPQDTVARLREQTAELARGGGPGVELWQRVVAMLADPGGAVRELDSRVRAVLTILKQDFLAPPKAAELAKRVGLSSGRLIHLFSEQMNLPVRRYVLWLRLRDVVLSLAMGHSLTEAAHRAGFADSAHMTRTFRGMFGMPPSIMVERLSQVKLVFDVETSLKQDGPHRAFDAERLARAAEALAAKSDREQRV
jgi:AraC-like DNA-binding protein